MTGAEAATRIRRWLDRPRIPYSWPTDACSYEYHVRFVRHCNEHWSGRPAEFDAFVRAFADALDPP